MLDFNIIDRKKQLETAGQFKFKLKATPDSGTLKCPVFRFMTPNYLSLAQKTAQE